MLRPAARASAARFRSGWPVALIHRDAEFVFRRPERRRDSCRGSGTWEGDGNKPARVLAQIDLQIVADGVQNFEQRRTGPAAARVVWPPAKPGANCVLHQFRIASRSGASSGCWSLSAVAMRARMRSRRARYSGRVLLIEQPANLGRERLRIERGSTAAGTNRRPGPVGEDRRRRLAPSPLLACPGPHRR